MLIGSGALLSQQLAYCCCIVGLVVSLSTSAALKAALRGMYLPAKAIPQANRRSGRMSSGATATAQRCWGRTAMGEWLSTHAHSLGHAFPLTHALNTCNVPHVHVFRMRPHTTGGRLSPVDAHIKVDMLTEALRLVLLGPLASSPS